MAAISALFVWAGGLGQLVLTAPAGSHINPDAPARLTVNGATLNGSGDLSGWKVPVSGSIAVSAEVPICTDDGAMCTVVRVAGEGTAGKRGSLVLMEPARVTSDGPAKGRAAAVYDFAAVWCPPCNLLAAEVLETPEGLQALGGRSLTRVDVDSTDSWALKNQYQVGGYPTMIAVDAQGVEVARMLGYPGREATLAWLGSLQTLEPVAERKAAATGAAAAALARELAAIGDEAGARELLARVGPASDGATPVDAVIARLTLDGKPEDARWLFDHAVPGGDWIYAALDADPTLVARVPERVVGAPGEAAAGWLSAAADQTADPSLSRAFRAGALAGLEAARAGDLQLDRGRLTDLASMRAALGGLPSAYALLDEAAARWPAEFTWPFVKGRLALDAADLGTAEAEATRALKNAAGDQTLRAAMLLARVQREQQRPADALKTLDAALAAVPEPPAGVEVRTTRYRAEAVKLHADIAATPVAVPPVAAPVSKPKK
jgi:thiol-disulfide isomerase/thioredoxin